MKPNRLIHESSPYLRQHAHNPVDWYPWGEEALTRARELDRPIFLSVGYSSCHWCHVMERESFEDAGIAQLMNQHFVNIKVDREERPDIDSIYMNAVQLLTRHGGWPMSVFLSPDLRPFFGGTYFPPTSRFGQAGFKDVLLAVAKAYREKPDEVRETGSRLVEYLASADTYGAEELPSEEDFDRLVEFASRSFDPRYGGFGPAPKFPRSVEISVLLRIHVRRGDRNVLDMCERTLQGMALGGMYDQIGGGFHRYSTDPLWLVPHFEKMLYDNALLTRTYLEAFQITGNELYRRVASEVLDYVLREMTSPEGGFYSATDADSGGVEGSFFVWKPEEVDSVLGAESARVLCSYFNIAEGGNFEGGTSIPHVTRSLDEVAGDFGLEPAQAAGIVAEGRRKLYEVREGREKPFRDEKILTAWNGLMISAFARGAQVLGDPRYRDAAVRAADLFLREMIDDGRLLRVMKDGRKKVLAFLDDYAYLAEALIDIYETTFDLRYLREARRLMEFVLESFADGKHGGFFYTASDHEELIVRRKEPFDSATPSGGGVACLNLLRLERFTGEARLREAAEDYCRSVKLATAQAPMALGQTMIATDFLLNGATEVAVIGPLDDPSTRDLLRVAWEAFLPARVLVAAGTESAADLAAEIPLLAGRKTTEKKALAYVCRNFACRAPVGTPDALRGEFRVAPRAKG